MIDRHQHREILSDTHGVKKPFLHMEMMGLEKTVTTWRELYDRQLIPVTAPRTTELQKPRLGVLGIVREGEENRKVAVTSLHKPMAYSPFAYSMPFQAPRLRKEIV